MCFSENSILDISWWLMSTSQRTSLIRSQQFPRMQGGRSAGLGAQGQSDIVRLCPALSTSWASSGLEQLSANSVKNMPHFMTSSEKTVVKVTKFIPWVIPNLFLGRKICLPVSFIHNFEKSYTKSATAFC